jgi:hypothetical protein
LVVCSSMFIILRCEQNGDELTSDGNRQLRSALLLLPLPTNHNMHHVTRVDDRAIVPSYK